MFGLNYKKGFTLLEVLVVLALMAIIITIVSVSFGPFIRTKALEQDEQAVLALLDRARSSSINGKFDSQYGVYFSTSTAVLFTGESYSPTSPTNEIYPLNPRVEISEISLIGGTGDTIVFSRLNGRSTASGTISLSLKDYPMEVEQIYIYGTGIIESD